SPISRSATGTSIRHAPHCSDKPIRPEHATASSRAPSSRLRWTSSRRPRKRSLRLRQQMRPSQRPKSWSARSRRTQSARAPSRSDPNIATRQEHHTNHDTRKAGADTMNKTIITALALGIIGSGAAYYVWCSLQWKENAEKARASTSVESEGATAANEAEYAADEPQPGTAAPTTPTPIDP